MADTSDEGGSVSWLRSLVRGAIDRLSPRAALDVDDTDPRGHCPRCERSPLLPEHGALHEAVCPRCQGRFVHADATERLIVDELGISRDLLLELAVHLEVPRVRCPGCSALLWAARIRGQPVSLCKSCGGLWCDAGELRALSDGRYEEVEAQSGERPATSTTNDDERSLCVLQVDTPFAGRETLAEAFHGIARFTTGDAGRAARLACGVLAEGLGSDDARRLVDALARLDVPAVAAPADVLHLPRAREVIIVEPEERGFFLHDHYGKRREVPWAHVEVAGIARLAFDVRPRRMPAMGQRLRGKRTRPRHRFPGMTPSEEPARPSRVEETIVDLFVAGAQRLRFRAGSVRLQGAARGGDRESLFLELAREMLQRSPDALVPRTRAFLDDGKVPSYDGVIHFERELAWQRWRRAR